MLIPLTPAMQEQPSSFMVSALEPARVWQAPWADLRAALDAQALWQPLCTVMLARLLDQKQQRSTLLALTGRERYLRLCHQQPALAARVPLVHPGQLPRHHRRVAVADPAAASAAGRPALNI